jgi:hypothetical protein
LAAAWIICFFRAPTSSGQPFSTLFWGSSPIDKHISLTNSEQVGRVAQFRLDKPRIQFNADAGLLGCPDDAPPFLRQALFVTLVLGTHRAYKIRFLN